MKRDFLAFCAFLLLGTFLTACGGSNNTAVQLSGLSKRLLASNSFAGNLNIIDAQLDQFSFSLITVSNTPQRMALTPDRSLTLVYNATGPQINIITNATETNSGGIALPDVSNSMVAMSAATGFASVRNAQVLEVLDLTNIKLSGSVSIPNPQQIVLSGDGKKLLVFSDSLQGSMTVVDTATATTNPSAAATTVSSPSFDFPVYGVFSSDNTKAYILSCGVECGGAAAKVTVLDMTTTPPTPGASVAVPGATVGFLDSTTLYVAGNSSTAAGTGMLTAIDVGTLTPAAPLAIGDGFHRVMGLDNHGHLYIGAKTCSQLRCLTVYDTAAHTATVEVNPDPTQNGNGFGDLTGNIQQISGRDRLYLAQGGEMRMFDTVAGQALPPSEQLDAVGFIQDVIQIDP